ncbi:hypothetical protein D3C76_1628460 [compost metagenome]
MLLPGRHLDRRYNLARDAELGKRFERSELIPPKVPDRFIKADHAFLNNILTVGTDQEIGSSFGTHKTAVLVNQVLQRFTVTVADGFDNVFVILDLII